MIEDNDKCASIEEESTMCNAIVSIVGVALLVIRVLAIIFYASWEEILYTSNLIAIATAIALLLQLRSTYLNSISATAMPFVFATAAYDVWKMIITATFSVWTLTVHIPTVVVGIIVLSNAVKLLRLVPLVFGTITVLVWMFVFDHRFLDFWFALYAVLLYAVPTAIIAYVLYRNGAIGGLTTRSLCDC